MREEKYQDPMIGEAYVLLIESLDITETKAEIEKTIKYLEGIADTIPHNKRIQERLSKLADMFLMFERIELSHKVNVEGKS